MKLDLTKEDLFKNDEIELKKKCTIIFGKNGTGKSSLAKIIQEQCSDKDVRVFQGFKGVIGENNKLNAIILGNHNAEINEKISKIQEEIARKKIEIKGIKSNINKPEDNRENMYTKRENVLQDEKKIEAKIEKFYTTSASEIKNASNPQLSDPSYNKKTFQTEIAAATTLQSKDININKEILRADVKIAKEIILPYWNLEELQNKVFENLSKIVEEEIKLPRLKSSEKRQFAKQGLNLHKSNEICSFCGGTIGDETIKELKKYFAVDDVKELQQLINSNIEEVKSIIEELLNVEIKIQDFYTEYKEDIEILLSEFENIKNKQNEFLLALLESLKKKQIDIFSKIEAELLDIPKNFKALEEKYNDLVVKNNNNDLKKSQQEARKKLRLHKIKMLLDVFQYEHENDMKKICLQKVKMIEEAFNKELEKIQELENSVHAFNEEIMELESLTQSEKKLADNINESLKSLVSFEMEYVKGGERKGFYLIKSLKSKEIRKITELSTGEKNIIAFLYFVEKLNEIEEDKPIKDKVVVFDDPMNSNDDTMQYLIIEELQGVMKRLEEKDKFILLTHNKHFYINVKYGLKYNKHLFLRLSTDGMSTEIEVIDSEDKDFLTNYEAIWKELEFMYLNGETTSSMLLNPIRRIIETYTKFNSINQNRFVGEIKGAKKLFNVNSHSIDDLEAELNGKSKSEIMKIMKECFVKNDSEEHFSNHCNWDIYVI